MNFIDPSGRIALVDDAAVALIIVCVFAISWFVVDQISPSTPQSGLGLGYGDSVSVPFPDLNKSSQLLTKDNAVPNAIPTTLDIPKINDKKNKIFPYSPFDFHPIGLELKVYREIGTGNNGGIIKWVLPETDMAFFEWDEDYRYGRHYHCFSPGDNNEHNGMHYFAGEYVPEPWNTFFFGG